MWKEFKEFAFKGNVIDLAVAVIIGGAFGKIVTSIVNDLIMPLVGIIVGGIDFTALTWEVKDAVITYGAFIQNVVDFFIIVSCIFIALKLLSKLKRKQEEVAAAPPAPSKEEVLLTEIRDILKQKQ